MSEIFPYVSGRDGTIHEGLIATYPPEVLMRTLDRILRRKVKTESDDEGTVLVYLFAPYDTSMLAHLADASGYYIASWKTRDKLQGGPWNQEAARALETWPASQEIVLVLEAKYDVELSKIPSIAYHATTQRAVSSILKFGITPASGGKKASHPERIYLTYQSQDAHQLADELTREEGSSAVLTVDLSKLSGLVARIDRDFLGYGFYVNKNIPPDRIVAVSPASGSGYSYTASARDDDKPSTFIGMTQGPHGPLP